MCMCIYIDELVAAHSCLSRSMNDVRVFLLALHFFFFSFHSPSHILSLAHFNHSIIVCFDRRSPYMDMSGSTTKMNRESDCLQSNRMMYKDQRKYEEEQEDESLLVGQVKLRSNSKQTTTNDNNEENKPSIIVKLLTGKRLIERKEETNKEEKKEKKEKKTRILVFILN